MTLIQSWWIDKKLADYFDNKTPCITYRIEYSELRRSRFNS